MTVHPFDPDRPRHPKPPPGDSELREALADLAAFYYADDLTVTNREPRYFAAYRRAADLLTPQEMEAAMDRLHTDPAVKA